MESIKSELHKLGCSTSFNANCLKLNMVQSNQCLAFGVSLAIGSLLLCITPSFSKEAGFFAPSNTREEFIQSIPSDCDYIAESTVLGRRSFFLVQPCHRGGGARLQEIPRVETIDTGIIYIPKQSLIDGGEGPTGFWCSRIAKRSGRSFSMTCTRDGWRVTAP